jgi:hypothetical protein
MNKSFLTAAFSLFFLFNLKAQYFQQEVHYNIKVTLDDKNRLLTGELTLDYTNHSPQSLSYLWFHLWPNAYKNDSTAMARQFLKQKNTSFLKTGEKDRGYIDNLKFESKGKTLSWNYHPEHIDICKVELLEPLAPGQTITITTPFRVKIPVAPLSRLGHAGDAFYISQWYPKPAVFDKDGWHYMPYLDQGEFYSEFGSFEVSITLPKNYVIAATGILQNAEEQQWIDSIAQATKAISVFDTVKTFPPSSSELKTLVFKQDHVHDFAWFADKRFHVMQSSVTLPHSGREVKTAVYFTNDRPDLWKKAAAYVDSALYYYSLWVGDYPYDYCSAVDGVGTWGGMEYPMVTIIGKTNNDIALEDVILHEVGHNWFYGILGSNERRHAWMDEGINTSCELRYYSRGLSYHQDAGSAIYGINRLPRFLGLHSLSMQQLGRLEYLLHARQHTDQPASLSAEEFTASNYAAVVYVKTALAFDYLRQYLGDALYDSCMHRYFNQWKFRHPGQDDLRQIFEDCSGRKLNWFFDGFLYSNKKSEVAIASIRPLMAENLVNPSAQSFGITLKNKGDIDLPVKISAFKNGMVQSEKWIDGFRGKQKIHFSCAHCDEIRLDASPLDLFEINNRIKTKGLFKKARPLKLRWLFGNENEQYQELFFTPLAGWNEYDKWMPGISLHNRALVAKPFEYSLMPLYSSGTKSFSGNGNFDWSFFPSSNLFHRIVFSAEASRFAYFRQQANDFTGAFNLHYTAIPVALKFDLRKKDALSHAAASFRLRNISTLTDERIFDEFAYRSVTSKLHYQQAVFNFTNNRLFDPYSVTATLENGKNYTKAQAELNYMISYRNPGKGIRSRLFAGAFLRNDEKLRNYKFRMSAWSGYQDYLFDNWFLGRSEAEGILSQQMELHDGGFKSFSFAGQSDKWLAALNLSFDFPVKLPMAFFFDAGMVPKEKFAGFETESFYYDGGLSFFIIRNALELHVPLFRSSAIRDAQEANDKKFKDNIRFVFSIRNFGIRSLRSGLNFF